MGDPAVDASALRWSITAMSETAERLPYVRAWDRPRAFAAIAEAVWWFTIVDATLVRHHLAAYDGVVAGQAPAERRLIEGTLTGLRFVRNRIGREASPAEFIQSVTPGPGAGSGRVTDWRWRPVPEPALTSLAPRGQAWDDAVPGVPGSPGRPHHREDLRAGRGVPGAGRRERDHPGRGQRAGRRLVSSG